MGVLLTHVLEDAGTNFEVAGGDGVIALVSVTDVAWTLLAYDEWRSRARGGGDSRDGFHDRWYKEADWFSLSPTELDRPLAIKEAGEGFAKAVAKCLHCATFMVDPSFLPPDFGLSADFRIVLPPLTGTDISILA
jgi:hypothetical protein